MLCGARCQSQIGPCWFGKGKCSARGSECSLSFAVQELMMRSIDALKVQLPKTGMPRSCLPTQGGVGGDASVARRGRSGVSWSRVASKCSSAHAPRSPWQRARCTSAVNRAVILVTGAGAGWLPR